MREDRLRALYRDVTRGDRQTADLLRRAANEHAGDPTPYSGVEAQLFAKIAVLLLDAAGLIERAAFARDVAALPHTPPTVITRLLEDDHVVAVPVLELSPLSEIELLRLVSHGGVERTHCAIARRETVGETLTDVLVGEGRPPVLQTIAENPGAKLSRTSLEMLCDAAARLTAVGTAMAQRSDLPAGTVALLERRMAVHPLTVAKHTDDALITIVTNGDEAEEVAVAWRSPLSVRMTDFLIARGRRRVLVIVAGNTGAEISQMGFLVLATIATDHPEMDQALARRSDLPLGIARHLQRRLSNRMQMRIDELVARDLARGRRPFVLRHV